MNKFNTTSGGGLTQKVYVLKWDCGHCGTHASFADGRCLNCANPFDDQEVDKISDTDFQQVHDNEIKQKVLEMMGWFCSSCSSYNRNLTRDDFNSGNINCNCDSCANELNVKEDGDYILKDGPSASTPAGAVRAMIKRNLKIMSRIQAEKAGRVLKPKQGILKKSTRPRVGPRAIIIEKNHRNKILRILQEKDPKWYWRAGVGVSLLAGFLAYKGLEEHDVTIDVNSFEWSRNIVIDSVQRLSKSDWAEDVDGSIYQTAAFHKFIENNRYHRTTGREHNHNSDYCYTTPDSEPVVTSYTCRSGGESCTATSGGGISCVPNPDVCDIPVWGTRDFEVEHCEYIDFDINDWNHDRNLSTPIEGEDEPIPYWHEFEQTGNKYNTGTENVYDIGDERESGRTETYTIHVSYDDGKKTDELEIPQGIWEILSITSECSAKASFLRGVNIDTIDWKQCS